MNDELQQKLFIALVIIPVLFGIFKGWKEMSVATVAVALALAFANLDKLKFFKGGGFEAHMKDVEKAVDKAYAAIEQLKELGLAVSAPIVDELAVSGLIVQFLNLEGKLQRVDDIRENLRKLGATETEIENVCLTMYTRIDTEHRAKIVEAWRKANPSKEKEIEAFRERTEGYWILSELEAELTKQKFERTPQLEEAIEDWRHFQRTRKLRRPHLWQM